MKALYLRNADKTRLDIRALAGDKLKHYNVTQGACSDGEHIFIAFEQKANKAKKREHRIKIVKFDPTAKKILKISAPLYLGHANDMCASGNFLYITHSGTKKIIHKVNKTTFAKCKDISIAVPKKYKKNITGFNGIAKVSDGYILRCMGGSYGMNVDNAFKFKSAFKFTNPFKDKEDAQGITSKGGTIYRAYSRLQSASKNYICKFKSNGTLISKAKLETKGELENVFILGGSLYGMVYRKKKKDKKNTYMSYIFKAK